jgi:KUP system potassium uptake protein
MLKDSRIELKDLSARVFRIIARFGFMETPTIGEIVYVLRDEKLCHRGAKTSFFLGRETIVSTRKPGMGGGASTSLLR